MSEYLEYGPTSDDQDLANKVYENYGHGQNDAAHRIAFYREKIRNEALNDAVKVVINLAGGYVAMGYDRGACLFNVHELCHQILYSERFLVKENENE